MTRWYVVWTKARSERDICEEISDFGFDAFTPIERRKRFKNGHKFIYEQALFPGYVFARFDLTDGSWSAINHIDGVRSILCNGNGDPCPVPPGTTEKLRTLQNLGVFDHTKTPEFQPGASVILNGDGAFAQFVGKVLKVRSADRALVLTKYLNQELLIDVPFERLSLA